MIHVFTAVPAGYAAGQRQPGRQKAAEQHLLARRLLAEGLLLLGVTGEEDEAGVLADEHGKPCLAGENMPQINISHCDALAAVAVAPPGKPVGIDAEHRFDPKPSLLRAICTPQEWEIIAEAESAAEDEEAKREARSALTGLLWSRKESYLKWKGIGLRVDPSSLAVLGPEDAAEAAPSPGMPWRRRERSVGGEDVLFFELQSQTYTLCVCCGAGTGEEAAPPRMLLTGENDR